MTGTFRGAKSVEKLLKIARLDVEALRVDLADIERAQETSKRALEDILQSVRREAKTAEDAQAMAAYEDAMRERRVNIRKTLNALESAADTARDKLNAAVAEMAKLEHLADVNARQAAHASRRREARTASEQPSPTARIRYSG